MAKFIHGEVATQKDTTKVLKLVQRIKNIRLEIEAIRRIILLFLKYNK